jgi:hypothetical protein
VFASLAAASPLFADGATRSLADFSGPGTVFTVTITVETPPGTLALGLEDSPPPGWTQIDNISEGGTYNADTHEIKWGPFFEPFPLQVAYDLVPVGDPTDADCFLGTVSFNGFNQPIRGDECFPPPVPAVSDWAMVMMAMLVLALGTAVLRTAQRNRPTHKEGAV